MLATTIVTPAGQVHFVRPARWCFFPLPAGELLILVHLQMQALMHLHVLLHLLMHLHWDWQWQRQKARKPQGFSRSLTLKATNEGPRKRQPARKRTCLARRRRGDEKRDLPLLGPAEAV